MKRAITSAEPLSEKARKRAVCTFTRQCKRKATHMAKVSFLDYSNTSELVCDECLQLALSKSQVPESPKKEEARPQSRRLARKQDLLVTCKGCETDKTASEFYGGSRYCTKCYKARYSRKKRAQEAITEREQS